MKMHRIYPLRLQNFKVVLADTIIFAVSLALLAGCGTGRSPNSGTGTTQPPAASMIAIAISPSSASLRAGSSQQFTASVTGTSDSQVVWQVNGVTGGRSSSGTISTTGLYIAPLVVPNPPTISVAAVSQADGSKSASATVAINPPPASKFIYGVSGFEPSGNGPEGGQIDSATGMVSPVPGSPFDAGLGQSNILQVLADPQGRFIYTVHLQASSFGNLIGESGIGAQKVDPQTGALTIVPNFPNFQAGAVAIEGLGRFVYLGTSTGLDIYTIDQNTGTLTKSSSSGPAALGTPSPDGRFMFSPDGTGLIETLSIDQKTGVLTVVPGTPVPVGNSPAPLVIEADGKFLYAANSTEGTVSVFAVGADGMLTPVSGSPFKTATQATWLALTPDGQFLYGIFGFDPDRSLVEGFQVTPSMGTFAPIQNFPPIPAVALALDGSGKFAYLMSISGGLGTFSIDSGSGILTKTSSVSGPGTDQPTNLVTVAF
jgi:6-phosphogluconolactonase (cycloisomerase 2 family)